MKKRPLLLVILDGFGSNPQKENNAVLQADAPVLSRLLNEFPHTKLEASEKFVGLPQGFMGNSEVGHLNIGAGRIVYQDFSLISAAIEDGTFFTNPVFTDLFKELLESNRALHLMGLLSDGGVHSHLSHLFALIRLCKEKGVKCWIHAFTDGRDTSPTSGIDFIQKLESYCRDSGTGTVATLMGRFFAMDRDNRWDRTENAFRAIVYGQAEKNFISSEAYIRSQYDESVTDEFLVPGVRKGYSGIQKGDGVVFFNFRADRARQLTRALTQNPFDGFPRPSFEVIARYVCLTSYDDSFHLRYAFGKPKVLHTLGELVSQRGEKQLRIAETEKYAHVTYFFNGGEEKVFEGEKRILIPSPREVKTYDLKPEMSARLVTEKLLSELSTCKYQLVVVNFANPDMVGHTGNLKAAIQAVEVVSECMGKILEWVEKNSAILILTADHGNCEMMKDEKGMPLTSHTLLPVPFVLVDAERPNVVLREGGRLCDIAPTILDLWGVNQPMEMTGKTLLA